MNCRHATILYKMWPHLAHSQGRITNDHYGHVSHASVLANSPAAPMTAVRPVRGVVACHVIIGLWLGILPAAAYFWLPLGEDTLTATLQQDGVVLPGQFWLALNLALILLCAGLGVAFLRRSTQWRILASAFLVTGALLSLTLLLLFVQASAFTSYLGASLLVVLIAVRLIVSRQWRPLASGLLIGCFINVVFLAIMIHALATLQLPV